MDIILVILLILALISAIDFNQSLPPAPPEWNPLEIFFQGYLGWSIEYTFVICGGTLILAVIVTWVIGKITGLSKGTIFGSSRIPYQDQDYNDLTYYERVEQAQAEQANIQRGIFGPMFVIIVVFFVMALVMMK